MDKKESVSNRQYTGECKVEAVRLAGSIGGNAAAKRLGIPRSTMTNWVRRSKAGTLGEVEAAPAKRPVSELEAENARLRRELANATLDAQVAAIHAASKRSYGRDRIVRGLRKQGLQVGHERVRKSLRRLGLRAVYKRPYRVTTDSNHSRPIAANVLDRRFAGWTVKRAWVADVTYVATVEGWLYLAVVMDLASRRIVGWSMSDRIKGDLVCEALRSAYWRRKPTAGLIMHTDRGSQYTSVAFGERCKKMGVRPSMGTVGDAYDNAMAESFFATLECELIDRRVWQTKTEARLALFTYIEGWYNPRCRHSALGLISPANYERKRNPTTRTDQRLPILSEQT